MKTDIMPAAKSGGKFELNAFQIKLLACAFMLIDHIGYLLLPQLFFLRVIGRLAFPLFAFMIANGFRHTRSVGRYFARLVIFAAVFQPLYAYCMGGTRLNIFATLALGLLAIWAYEACRRHGYSWAGYAAAALICALAVLIKADYSYYGVLLILSAHIFFDQPQKLAPAWLVINILPLTPFIYLSNIQAFSLFALAFAFRYNSQPGRGGRWLFYAFYCLHIPLLYGLSLLL